MLAGKCPGSGRKKSDHRFGEVPSLWGGRRDILNELRVKCHKCGSIYTRTTCPPASTGAPKAKECVGRRSTSNYRVSRSRKLKYRRLAGAIARQGYTSGRWRSGRTCKMQLIPHARLSPAPRRMKIPFCSLLSPGGRGLRGRAKYQGITLTLPSPVKGEGNCFYFRGNAAAGDKPCGRFFRIFLFTSW